jgi:hypothetical protein
MPIMVEKSPLNRRSSPTYRSFAYFSTGWVMIGHMRFRPQKAHPRPLSYPGAHLGKQRATTLNEQVSMIRVGF